jgi:hypothetical protein
LTAKDVQFPSDTIDKNMSDSMPIPRHENQSGGAMPAQSVHPEQTPFDLDSLMTVEEFAQWQRMAPKTVRRHLHKIPGVIRESREWVRIHPRTYLAKRTA